jgi:Uma2 family endonuclease
MATEVVVVDEPLYEVVNGERVEVPRMGAWASWIATYLAGELNNAARGGRLGAAFTETLFHLRDDLPDRRPDVAFVGTARCYPAMFGPVDLPVFNAVPNIAVEVVSPSNTATEIATKRHEYFQAGVEIVWVIYPSLRTVEVYDSPAGSRVLGDGDVLDGGTALPGFRLPVADLFANPLAP